MGRVIACGTQRETGHEESEEEKTQRVENVHTFPGHIACDGASNSEVVIPLYRGTALWGVLDIDSPRFSRFSPEDQQGLERFAAALSEALPEMDG